MIWLFVGAFLAVIQSWLRRRNAESSIQAPVQTIMRDWVFAAVFSGPIYGGLIWLILGWGLGLDPNPVFGPIEHRP